MTNGGQRISAEEVSTWLKEFVSWELFSLSALGRSDES